jgi:hypothetical protein
MFYIQTMDRRPSSRFATWVYGIFAGRGCVKKMSRKIDDCDDRSAEDREERRASAVNGAVLSIGLAHSETASMID